jgi:hypothetical protein
MRGGCSEFLTFTAFHVQFSEQTSTASGLKYCKISIFLLGMPLADMIVTSKEECMP